MKVFLTFLVAAIALVAAGRVNVVDRNPNQVQVVDSPDQVIISNPDPAFGRPDQGQDVIVNPDPGFYQGGNQVVIPNPDPFFAQGGHGGKPRPNAYARNG